MWDFAAGCMRTYLILKEKAERDARRRRDPGGAPRRARPTGLAEPTGSARRRCGRRVDEDALAAQGYGHERLDQLVTELLLGVR